jgi:hypothetical protein
MNQHTTNPFDSQRAVAAAVRAKAAGLVHGFRDYEPRASIAAAGGLLTVPMLQANTVRLEAIAHLAVAGASGRKRPNKQDAARWFRQVGGVFDRLEDPSEDVFVARVHFEGRNHSILEGLAEANAYHLQHILASVEHMPDQGVYGRLKQSCRSMLALSDAICARSSLLDFELGDEYGQDALPIEDIPTIKTLAARVAFTRVELRKVGIDARALGGFCLPSNQRDVGFGGYGDSPLERRPLIDFGDEIVVALPTAMAVAMRRAVIDVCVEMGAAVPLKGGILEAISDELSLNPAIAQLDIPPTEAKADATVISSWPIEFQPGLWFHLVIVTEDLRSANETGFEHTASSAQTNEDLQKSIDDALAEAAKAPGFKMGLSLVLLCGIGRGMAVEFTGRDHWLVTGTSSYDFEVLGWRTDFDIAELIKFLLAEGTAAAMGFPSMAINGLLARMANAYGNDGHVVPHEEMPDGSLALTLLVPTNAHLQARAEHHSRFDKHAVVDRSGSVLVVRRRDRGDRSPGSVQRVYLSHSDARILRYRAVWRMDDRRWWLETASDAGRPHLYPVFEMQMVWMERLAPVLADRFPGLPEQWTWRLVTPEWPAMRSDAALPLPRVELRNGIESGCDLIAKVVTTRIGMPFFQGLRQADNLSEVVLLEALVEKVMELTDDAPAAVDEILAKVVPSPQARQLHAFAPQDFRDHVHGSVPDRPVEMSRFDDASQRLGLGWHGVDRPGGTIHGRDTCTQALNAITVHAEEMLCAHLRQLERHSLVRRLVENHESSMIDKTRWERTSSALLDMSANPGATRDELYDHILKANATSYASRVLIEAALCESPVGRGFEVADFDLSNLLAMAMMVHHLGGYSDGIRYEGMKPEIRISPAGEVQIDTSFFDAIVTPVGESFVSGQIDRHGRDYPELLVEPEPIGDGEESRGIDERFAAAWKAEVSVSLIDFRAGLEALENRLFETGQAFETMPRPELLKILAASMDDPEGFVSALETLPRDGWKSIPVGFTDQDRQPWRFRRRLAVSRRPILRIEPGKGSDVIIAPGMLRDAFRVLLHNHHYGHYDINALSSAEMKAWREHIVAEQSAKFEDRVVARLEELGWNARRGVKFTEILGKNLEKDHGDIDVLAWHPDGRVRLLECKDLHFAKTVSEIAKQLHKFRGKQDEKGRPDLLRKHLNRLVLARENEGAFRSHLKLPEVDIDAALVFANPVPMTFAAERIQHAIELLTYDELEGAFGKPQSSNRDDRGASMTESEHESSAE